MALSSSIGLNAPGSAPISEEPAYQAPELSVHERLDAVERALKALTSHTPYTDELEYHRAITALANGDRGKALDAYLKKGGRIPRNETTVCS